MFLDQFAGQHISDTPQMLAASNAFDLRRTMDAALKAGALPSNGFRVNVMDAAAAGGLIFLEGELEKRDPKVYEPLTSVTWMRDMPIESGGGWVEQTSQFFVDYQMPGPNFYGLTGSQSTVIPVIQANLSKDVYPVFPWQNVMKVNFIDMQKTNQVGRSLDDMLDKGIKLNWNKTLDLVTYNGPTPISGYGGILNNAAISASSAAIGSGGGTAWSGKTPQEILQDVNALMVSTWAASQYDTTGMAAHFLVPPTQYSLLLQPVTTAGSVSILTYLMENNIGKSQGVDLKIFPSRWCIGAGSGSTDRMAGYVLDRNRVRLDIPVPIMRVMTVPSIDNGGGAYLTLYAGNIGVVKVLYPQSAAYVDGI